MKKRTERKQLLIYLIILNSMLVLNFISVVYAQELTAEGVTTIVGDLHPEFIFDSIKKTYEVSSSSLEKGYSADLTEKDAFRLNINERNYYIIIWNITDDGIIAVFPGNRFLSFGLNDVILVDINQDNKLDIKLELKSIEPYENLKKVVSIELKDDEEFIIKSVEEVNDRKANFYIKKFVEKELIPEGDYFELFDLTVRLTKETIYGVSELGAFVTFENFGEGPSEIDIVYSIINKNGKEVYRGVDSKIVQTEDLVVKNFNFLELPLGKYILRTEIFYGKNQTGDSEQDFEIIKKPFFFVFKDALIFVGSLIALFIMVVYLRKHYRKKSAVKEVVDVKKGGDIKKGKVKSEKKALLKKEIEDLGTEIEGSKKRKKIKERGEK